MTYSSIGTSLKNKLTENNEKKEVRNRKKEKTHSHGMYSHALGSANSHIWIVRLTKRVPIAAACVEEYIIITGRIKNSRNKA